MSSARRPLARTPVTKRATVGCVGRPRRPCDAPQLPLHPKSCRVVRFSQLRRPAALLPIRGFMLRVGAGIRAGTSGLGDRTFSSDSTLASPGFRASFVLRDHGHIKRSATAQPDLHKTNLRSNEYVSAPAASALTPTAAVVATAAVDGAGIRSRNDTGLENVSIGQPRAAASLRRARSGFTAVGCPTVSSIGRSVIESEYA